jgi:hypothetical protein
VVALLALTATAIRGTSSPTHPDSDLGHRSSTLFTQVTSNTTSLDGAAFSSTIPGGIEHSAECARTYRNNEFGFEFQYPACNPDQDGYILVPDVTIEGQGVYPWLLTINFCSESLRTGNGSCGMSSGNDPDFLVEDYRSQNITKSPFSFADTVTSLQAITVGGADTELLSFQSVAKEPGREVNLRHGKYFYAFWVLDDNTRQTAWFDELLSSIHFLK